MVAGRQPLPEGAVGLEDWLYDLSTLYLDSCSALRRTRTVAVRLRHGRRLPSHRLPDLRRDLHPGHRRQTEDGSYVYAALEAPAPGCDLFLISADKARTCRI